MNALSYSLKVVLLLVLLATLFLQPASTLKAPLQQPAPITIDGQPNDWPQVPREHGPVVVDGEYNDWNVGVLGSMDNNTGTVVAGEYIWKDRVGDERTDFFSPDKAVDIVSFHVTSNSTHLLMLIRLRDLGNLGVNGAPAVLIALDTDMNYTNGERWLALYSDTNTSEYGRWDYQVAIDLANTTVASGSRITGGGNTPLKIYDPSWNDVSTVNSVFVANNVTDCVEVAIYWSDIGVSNLEAVSNVRFTVATVRSDGAGHSWDIDGSSKSNVLDCITSYGTNTWDEVQDQVIDGDSDPATDSGSGRDAKGYIDVGFNSLPEPTSPRIEVLDNSTYIILMDEYNDHRDDYLGGLGTPVVEDWDVDLIEFRMLINSTEGYVYFLIHVRGYANIDKAATPAIAIVLDYTPDNLTDGVSEWVYSPYGWGNTDTNISYNGSPEYWQYIIWFEPINSTGSGGKVVVLAWDGSTGYTETLEGVASNSTHFIEFSLPITAIGGLNRLSNPFRLIVLSYAYNRTTSQLNNIGGSNAYDVLPGNLTDLVPAYGSPDNSIDTLYFRQLTTRVTDVQPTNTQYALGDIIKAYAKLEYYNISSNTWNPLPGEQVSFYLIGSSYYIGQATTNASGYAVLATTIPYTIPPGNYTLVASYNGSLYYLSTRNGTIEITLVQPPTPLPEPPIPTLIALAIVFAILWRRK